MKLALVTIVPPSVAFLPFLVKGVHYSAFLTRLFPFQRGLSHAYWAPNFWALYNALDKVLYAGLAFGLCPCICSSSWLVARRAGINMDTNASLTRGLVGDVQHAVLPAITPTICALITLVALLVCPCFTSQQSPEQAPFSDISLSSLC